MPSKKPARAKTSAAAARSPRARKSARRTGALGSTVILLGLVAVAGAALLVAARGASEPPVADAPETPASMAPADTPRSAAALPRREPPRERTRSTPVESADAAADAEITATSPSASPVTIAGCLARDGDRFKLTDTAGADAPKTRSWKSGFLKKGSATIDLVEGGGVTLRDHIGRRVSVTGTLIERRMQVRSLRRVSSSCD